MGKIKVPHFKVWWIQGDHTYPWQQEREHTPVLLSKLHPSPSTH